MNTRVLQAVRIIGIFFAYSFIFAASVFLTMSILIKGDEIPAPDLSGLTLKEAYDLAAQKGLYLKKIAGDFGRIYPPQTVVNQHPGPGSQVKAKSVIKIFINSELAEVVVPELTGKSLRQSEQLLKQGKLTRGFVSQIAVRDTPIDTVIAQSTAPGSRLAENTPVDLLVSKGPDTAIYIMPDVIGKEAARVVVFFENQGLKISKIDRVSYYGLKPGVILKQFPSPGFEISTRNLITLQVSQ